MYCREFCAGVDEVGRGPLAGPVFAAAVVLCPFTPIPGLADSKQIGPAQRLALVEEIKEKAIAWAVATADVREIDRINILWASMLAMQRAVNNLACEVHHVLVDGNRTPDFGCPADWLVGGDRKSESIMAASIIAKVARDKEMEVLDQLYPGYGLARHKGYPTPEHLSALRCHGPSKIHRMSFAPCRQELVAP